MLVGRYDAGFHGSGVRGSSLSERGASGTRPLIAGRRTTGGAVDVVATQRAAMTMRPLS